MITYFMEIFLASEMKTKTVSLVPTTNFLFAMKEIVIDFLSLFLLFFAQYQFHFTTIIRIKNTKLSQLLARYCTKRIKPMPFDVKQTEKLSGEISISLENGFSFVRCAIFMAQFSIIHHSCGPTCSVVGWHAD